MTGANKPDLALRDVPGLAKRWLSCTMNPSRLRIVTSPQDEAASDSADAVRVAKRHGLEPDVLAAWLDYLALAQRNRSRSPGCLQKMERVGARLRQRLGTAETPSVVANSSDAEYRIPGRARARSVEVHPSPTLFVAVGWQSPIDGEIAVSAIDAHPECSGGGGGGATSQAVGRQPWPRRLWHGGGANLSR